MKRKDNKIEDCFIQLKDKETIFKELASGEMLVNLKGYAIVPKEIYLEIVGEAIDNGYGGKEFLNSENWD